MQDFIFCINFSLALIECKQYSTESSASGTGLVLKDPYNRPVSFDSDSHLKISNSEQTLSTLEEKSEKREKPKPAEIKRVDTNEQKVEQKVVQKVEPKAIEGNLGVSPAQNAVSPQPQTNSSVANQVKLSNPQQQAVYSNAINIMQSYQQNPSYDPSYYQGYDNYYGYGTNQASNAWTQQYDSSTGAYYWYNTETGMSQWDPPM